MELYKEFTQIPLSLLDIVRQIQSEPLEIDKKEIASLSEKVIIQEDRNKELKKQIEKEKRKIVKAEKELKFKSLLESYNFIKDKKKEITNLTSLKNQLERAKGKDFYYQVNDGFNPIYKVKRSKIMKMTDNSFFINKYKIAVEKEVKKLSSIKNKTVDEIKKINVLKNKLLKTIKINEAVDKYLDVDEKKIPKRIKSYVDTMLSNIEKKDKEGKYPIQVILTGQEIEF